MNNNRLQLCVCMLINTQTKITKANGEREPFASEKLYRSLVQSGADEDLAEKVTSQVASSLKDGDKTQEIYRHAFELLREKQSSMAARYSVKRALLELGPSGFPFEDFLAEMYKQLGYKMKTRLLVQGRCVEHELDIAGVKGDERFAAEVKFHNNPGIKSDLKVALYVHARFEDIAAQSGKGSETDYTKRMLITNTKFTQQVEAYGSCAGLHLVSWDYPAKGNLRELIDETGVHPVSCLTSISNGNKRKLMEQGVVLCKQLLKRTEEVERLGLSGKVMERLFSEAGDLCG